MGVLVKDRGWIWRVVVWGIWYVLMEGFGGSGSTHGWVWGILTRGCGSEAHPEQGWSPAPPKMLEGSTTGRSPTGGDAPQGGPPVLTPLSSAEAHTLLTLRGPGRPSSALRRPPLHPTAFSGGSLPKPAGVGTQGWVPPAPPLVLPISSAGCLNCSRVGELTSRLATLEAQASPNLGSGHLPLRPPRGTRALGVTSCPLLSPTPAVSLPGGPAGSGRAPHPSSTQRQHPGQGSRGRAALGVPGRPRESWG